MMAQREDLKLLYNILTLILMNISPYVKSMGRFGSQKMMSILELLMMRRNLDACAQALANTLQAINNRIQYQ